MIDRLWALWQLAHPGAGVGSVPLNHPLGPFPTLTVAHTLSTAALGYDYAAATSSATPARGPGADMAEFVANPLTVTLTAPGVPYYRADLEFHGVDHSKASFEGRLFINNPDAGPGTRPTMTATPGRSGSSGTAVARATRGTASRWQNAGPSTSAPSTS